MRSLDHRVGRDPAAIVRELDHLSKVEQRLFSRLFSASLVNLGHVMMYWLPSQRRTTARAAQAGKQPRSLPAGAVLVGAYAHPFNTNDFLGDLNDLIVKLESTDPRESAQASAQAG